MIRQKYGIDYRVTLAQVIAANTDIPLADLNGNVFEVAPEEPPAPEPQAWRVGVAYKIGDEVTHKGASYRCRQAHTSQSDWEPQLTPALWLRL